jgi:hypothetical protein
LITAVGQRRDVGCDVHACILNSVVFAGYNCYGTIRI